MIGCGGTIGLAVCNYLGKSGYKVQGGQRREPDYSKYPENFCWKHLDVNNENELNEFCKDCVLIINCSGSAYIMFEKVAVAAADAGAIYIDVSDALAFNDDIISRIDGRGTFYLASGFYPGITGVMLKKVINSFDKIHSICGYSGGAELYSMLSCLDIIMSGASPNCLNGYYLKNGEPVKCKSGMEYCENELFDKKVFLKPFLSNELYSLVKRYSPEKIDELCWYDVSSDNVVGLMAMKYYQLYNKMEFSELYLELSEYLKKIEKKTEKDEWAVLYITAKGISENQEKIVNAKIDLKSTSDITAYSIAETAVRALEKNVSEGIYWANDVISEDIMDRYKKECNENGKFCSWTYEEEYEL